MAISPENQPTNDACAPCAVDVLIESEMGSRDLEKLAEQLAPAYPLTVAAFKTMQGGLAHLDYIQNLEDRWQKVAGGKALPAELVPGETQEPALRYVAAHQLPATDANFDLLYCGGVLGLFSAAVMARLGYRVAVFDQRQVGTSHREWNISDEELERFVEAGLFSRAELETAVAGRYRHGIVRFHAQDIPEPAAELDLDHVLDVAIDLGKLLKMARARFEEAGGMALDFRTLRRVSISANGPVRAVIEVTNQAGQTERYGTRLVVNALGSISPLSMELQDGRPFDGVCPTVGTTASGFKLGLDRRQVDPDTGDVLLSIAHTQRGRQFIWEGFPGRSGEMTTYLFYYDLVTPELAAGQGLLDLFETYFELLPSYKEPGPGFQHLKPVYGYIPARHHRPRSGSASRRGIISVGDATSPQSALTFCGFGSQVRNLPRLTRLLDFALKHELLQENHLRQIGAHQSNISLVWVFSRFMQPTNPAQRSDDVNRMMNVFCATLAGLGPGLTRRFFQDRFGWREYNRLILTTAWRSPRVFPFTLQVLGLAGIRQWVIDYLKFSRESLLRTLYLKSGLNKVQSLETHLVRLNPALALVLAARREEWSASGLL